MIDDWLVFSIPRTVEAKMVLVVWVTKFVMKACDDKVVGGTCKAIILGEVGVAGGEG